MNTGIRRFILRLAVGLLAFLLGVTAAWAFGAFNPFQNSSGTRYYRHKRHGYYGASDRGVIYPIYREQGCRTKRPAPPADAPMPPSPPQPLR